MSKTTIAFIAVLVLLVVGLGYLATLSPEGTTNEGTNDMSVPENAAEEIKDISNTTNTMENIGNLDIKDVVVGTGAEARNGNKVTVHYVGTLENGTKFDSSKDRNQPFQFTLGIGQVIKGWDLGVAGMKVGGTRELVIPSELGYGPNGYPPVIPPNATLRFTVELLEVNP